MKKYNIEMLEITEIKMKWKRLKIIDWGYRGYEEKEDIKKRSRIDNKEMIIEMDMKKKREEELDKRRYEVEETIKVIN